MNKEDQHQYEYNYQVPSNESESIDSISNRNSMRSNAFEKNYDETSSLAKSSMLSSHGSFR